MGIFGWSYPPGCSGPPDYDDMPCEVCGKLPDDCICPDCPVCGHPGVVACYQEHGMVRTPEQSTSWEKFEAQCRADNEAEQQQLNPADEDWL